ncbi:MAG: hypothetical protein KDD94_04905 [Calditrichaeota bacterium]|nr:hypothetical protein [Calditrichota bacterium]
MSIQYQIDYLNDILYEDVTGLIDDAEAERAVNNHINYNNTHSGMKMFTSIQNAQIKVSTRCIVELARKSRDFYTNYRGTKWAIYSLNKYNYGLARMFASIASTSSFSIKVFKDRKLAEEWLNS